MINYSFKRIAESHVNDSLFSLMRHPDLYKYTKILNILDSFIDYFAFQKDEKFIKYPIFFVPCANKELEKVCLEFLSLKLSLRYNKILCTSLLNWVNRDEIRINECPLYDIREREIATAYDFWKGHRDALTDVDHKTGKVILCVQKNLKDYIKRKNNWIKYILTSPRKLYRRRSSLAITEKELGHGASLGVEPKGLYEELFCGDNSSFKIECYSNPDSSIENIFLFDSRNMDSYNSNDLEKTFSEVNAIKPNNCFLIIFDEANYYSQLRLVGKLHSYIEEFGLKQSDADRFIMTFSKEETDYLFSRNSSPIITKIGFEDDPEYCDYDEYIQDYLMANDYMSNDELNIISLCINKEIRDSYSSITDFGFSNGLDTILDNYWEKVFLRINNEIPSEENIAVVLPVQPLESVGIRELLVKELRRRINATITIYDSYAMEPRIRGERVGLNQIKQDKIIVLAFRPYSRRTSLISDSENYCIKDTQIAYYIRVPYITHREIAWSDYLYKLDRYHLSQCDYRKNYLKEGNPEVPQKPTYINNTENYSGRASSERTKVVVTIANCKRRIQINDKIIYIFPEDTNKRLHLDSYSAIEQRIESESVQALVTISDLISFTNSQIEENNQQDFEDIENRLIEKFKFTDKEQDLYKNKGIQIWRILLARKNKEEVNRFYELLKGINSKMVGRYYYECWMNLDKKDPTKPRSNALTKDLLTNLGLEESDRYPYLRALIRKSNRNRMDSRELNDSIENLLTTLLEESDINKAFSKVQDEDAVYRLNISSIEELSEFKDRLIETINNFII